jgi:uncharacterized tellurite resistance protein B-like protein
MDKITAGYKMLLILANADGEHETLESNIIKTSLGDEFEAAFSKLVIEAEISRYSALNHSQLLQEFDYAMHEFYRNSSKTERAAFLQYAMNLIKANANITREENEFIDHLFEAWETE